jgi:glycine dehydrogenase
MPIPAQPSLQQLENAEEFLARHIGIDAADEARMLPVIGSETRAELIDGIVPAAIRRAKPMRWPS